jgi:hypothetical protein
MENKMKSKSNITAKNYAADVASYLSKAAVKLDEKGHNRDSRTIKRMLTELTESVHFVMPDGGNLLNDKLKGIENMQIRLPYPKISVEYYVQGDSSSLEKSYFGKVHKRIIMAAEIPTSSIAEYCTVPDVIKDSDYMISVAALYFSEDFNSWMPCAICYLIPSRWDAGKDAPAHIDHIADSVCFGACTVKLFPDYLEGVEKIEKGNSVNYIKLIDNDLYDEVIVLLELIEALSCSNVKESIHQEASKKNAQRIKSHKKPIWETKFLTLVVNEKQDKRIKDSITSHASPRQHLRRGHIRRLPSKNIWVNSCVVGNIENGKVEKQYKIKK